MRRILLLSVFCPLLSLAKPVSSEYSQRAQNVRGPLASNAKITLDVYVGDPSTAPIQITQDGAPVRYTRSVTSPRRVTLAPATPWKLGSTVRVTISTVQSGTYDVVAADTTPPSIQSVSVVSVTPSEAFDQVIVQAAIVDQSAVTVHVGADQRSLAPTMVLRIPKGATTLTLEAVDAADNRASVQVNVPRTTATSADAAAPKALPPPEPVPRGCR